MTIRREMARALAKYQDGGDPDRIVLYAYGKPQGPNWESWVDDVNIVMEASGIIPVLERLIEYCHNHEGWQDDNAEILKDAERIVEALKGKISERA